MTEIVRRMPAFPDSYFRVRNAVFMAFLQTFRNSLAVFFAALVFLNVFYVAAPISSFTSETPVLFI